MKKAKKVYTDTPLIDEIVRQCSDMIMNGIVLKDEQMANDNETVSSIKASDRYSDIVNGLDMYEMYEPYTYSTLKKVPYMTKDLAKQYAKNNALIPDSIKPILQQIERQKFLLDYEEQNNYYRCLYGLPDLGERGIFLTDEQIKFLNIRTFDTSKYIHEMNNNEIKILEAHGIIDQLIEMYPNKLYLQHLGERRINPYLARKATPFALLYLPPADANEVHDRFKELIEKNRQYILSTLYSEAFKYQSVYYDRFIAAMIITQAFVDMIILSPEYIIRRDVFDLRTIQYIFESQGVEFFPEIPITYQKRLVKNLHRLIKFKSSDKNLVDIASLFGFENVELFKYYMLKIPRMNSGGTYKNVTTTNPKTGEEEEDLNANYELKFLKVDLDGSADEAIRDPFRFSNYDEFVEDDVYWNGPYTAQDVKNTILEHEFNMVITKYIGMDIVYSMTEMAFQLVYFINMIMYSDVDISQLTIDIPKISSTMKFSLIDCLIALFSLGYLYKELEDNIMYQPVQAMDVLGFNFEVDMDKLAEYVAEKGFTLEELGVEDFQIPSSGIFTYNQLIEIYTKNKNIYKHLVHEITNANDKNMYDIYRKIYESLFITKLNFEYFTQYGIQPKTYLEFLAIANNALYTVIVECKHIEDHEERRNAISKLINTIVDNIYVYLDQNIFNHIFHGIPTASMDYMRQYLLKVLNFFKSYKVDFTHTNIIYKLDDRMGNWISVIDRIYINHIFTKGEFIKYDDFISTWVHLAPKEFIEVKENLEIDITHWVEKLLRDKYRLSDKLVEILVHFLIKDNVEPWKETIQMLHHMWKAEVITYEDYIRTNVHLRPKDRISMEDNVFIERNYHYYDEDINGPRV